MRKWGGLYDQEISLGAGIKGNQDGVWCVLFFEDEWGW